MPEYDDEYSLPYLGHGNVGWVDESEPRKRRKTVKDRPFPFGFGIHAAHAGVDQSA